MRTIKKRSNFWDRSQQLAFWSVVRGRSRILLLIAVFCLFASVGLIALQMGTNRASVGQILLRVFLSGGFAVAYAAAAMARRLRYFPAIVLAQVSMEITAAKLWPSGPSLASQTQALNRQLIVLSLGAMFGIIVAYSLLMHFFRIEGKRYYEARTEMALAAEIHRSLVPPCVATVGGFEIYGASVPSGEVGGDLVDIVERPGRWIGYVADVSGHGVQSGVLMAMFKTALRAEIARSGSTAQMLGEVHRTVFPLKMGNMFVTAALLEGRDDGKVSLASAGHPPVLHYRKRSATVTEYGAMNPPLGIAEAQEFAEAAIQCESGDVLLVLTDGLTEVFDAKGNELGIDPLKAALVANAAAPLATVWDVLRKAATDFGNQIDDQTVLLARFRKND